jgi:hypothetical protein
VSEGEYQEQTAASGIAPEVVAFPEGRRLKRPPAHPQIQPAAAVCREVIVIQNDMPMQACMLSQPALADWKERSIYRGEQWRVSRIKCVPATARRREAI